MSYQNLQLNHATSTPAGGSPSFGQTLGGIEWAIVDMARVDGPRSLNPRSFFNRLMRRLFGFAAPQPLANERLEALRRFAVIAWHRAEIRTRDMRALFSAGFSSNDAARILGRIAERRGIQPEVEAWP
jgi:hypothetical protein